jgi:hypothetical protein
VLGLSVPAVKSLLVRARVGLAAADEARDTACHEIRAELADAHERGVRPSGLSRRHLHDCSGCRTYRSELRGVSRQLAALTPALGPLGALARLIGVGSGGGAAAGGTGSGVLVAGGAASAGTTVLGAAATHVAAVVAAAVVTAGGAVEIQRTVARQIAPAPGHHVKRSVSVGQGTSVEGRVAASVSAPLSSYVPAAVQQASRPAAHIRRSHRGTRPKRSARAHRATSAQATAPSQAAAKTSAATSPPATPASTTTVASTPSCQIPPATNQVPAATPTATTPACTPSTATGTSGSLASTTPGSSTGSTSSYGSIGTAGTASSTPPTTGSPVSPEIPGSQPQKS